MLNREKVTLLVSLFTITITLEQGDILFEEDEIQAINDLDSVGCVWALTNQNLPTQLTAQSLTFNFDEELGSLVSDWKFINKIDKVSHPNENFLICDKPMECLQTGKAVGLTDAEQILELIDDFEEGGIILLDLIIVKTSPDTLSCVSDNKIFDALHGESENCHAQLSAFDTAFNTNTDIDGEDSINSIVAYIKGENRLALINILARSFDEHIYFIAKSTETHKNIKSIKGFILSKIKMILDKLYFMNEQISGAFGMDTCPRLLQWAICHAWKADCHTEHSHKEKAEMRSFCTELITELGDVDDRERRGIIDIILQITNALGTLPRLTQGHNINIKNIKTLHYNELVLQNNLNHIANFVNEINNNQTDLSMVVLTAMEHESLKFLHLETVIAKQRLFHGLKETLNHLQIIVLSVMDKLNKFLQHIAPTPFDHPHGCNANNKEIICQNGPGVISSSTTALNSDITIHTSARRLEKTRVYFPRCLYKDGKIFRGNNRIFMKNNGTLFNSELSFTAECVHPLSHAVWRCGHLMILESEYDSYIRPAELGKDSRIFYLKFTKAIWAQYIGEGNLTFTNKQNEIMYLSQKTSQIPESNFPIILKNKSYNFQDFVISHSFEDVFLQEENLVGLVSDPHPENEISAQDRITGFLDHLDELEDTPELGSVIRISFYGIISLAAAVLVLSALVLYCWYKINQKQNIKDRKVEVATPKSQAQAEVEELAGRIGIYNLNSIVADLSLNLAADNNKLAALPPEYEDSAPNEETEMLRPVRGEVKVYSRPSN